MAIETTIGDGTGANGTASVRKKADVAEGLIVYTEPLRDSIAQTKAATNTTYGVDMNQNATFGGSPDGIHDGTDSVQWTGSNDSGANFVFDSTDQAQAGTKSVDGTATVNTDAALFTRGSAIANGSYVALTGFIYLTSWSTLGTRKDIDLTVKLAGATLGDVLPLSPYINTASLNTWQKFTIPIEDFNMPVSNMDELLVTTIDIGAGAPPDYYLDEMQWENTGAALDYIIEPDQGSIYYVTDLSLTLADAYDSTLASSSHQKIPYNTFLALAKLTTGIQFKLTTDSTIRFNAFFQQHLDFMTFPGITVTSGGDGTNTWVSYHIKFEKPFVMDSRLKDIFEITIAEDLSGLLFLKTFVRGYTEKVV
jgi:hypothetical protein